MKTHILTIALLLCTQDVVGNLAGAVWLKTGLESWGRHALAGVILEEAGAAYRCAIGRAAGKLSDGGRCRFVTHGRSASKTGL